MINPTTVSCSQREGAEGKERKGGKEVNSEKEDPCTVQIKSEVH